MKNYLMIIQYDGTSYNGWQKQGNTVNTIQETVEKTLSNLLQEDIEIHGSGRTDAGAHALRQTANFKCSSIIDRDVFLQDINRELPQDIRICSMSEVDMNFHSRLSAISKSYDYNINNSDRASVFRRKYVYNYVDKLDIELMKKATTYLVGTHDFRGFSSEKNLSKSCIRNLYEINIKENKNEITISFLGNGFIYNMVRIITGTLLEIGSGKKRMEDINKTFKTGKREFAGAMVPANGLFLSNVNYEGRI
ncbi:MAG: tRNA pseudouridine(38-40) synthase TruA [Lachnotalea sp.]